MFKFITQLFTKTPKKDDTVKYLITGLGNMGPDYDGTRHNIGFDVVDYLASEMGASFQDARYGFVAQVKHKGRTLILLKPTTYMNLSGQAVRYWLQKEKIPIERLLVIVDDLQLSFGTVRLKDKGGAGGHNGLKNIEQLLSTNQYPRLRFGIGNKYPKGQQVRFVLGHWNDREKDKLPKIIQHAAEAIKGFSTIGLARTMNQYNKDVLKAPKPKKKKTPPPSSDTPSENNIEEKK